MKELQGPKTLKIPSFSEGWGNKEGGNSLKINNVVEKLDKISKCEGKKSVSNSIEQEGGKEPQEDFLNSTAEFYKSSEKESFKVEVKPKLEMPQKLMQPK